MEAFRTPGGISDAMHERCQQVNPYNDVHPFFARGLAHNCHNSSRGVRMLIAPITEDPLRSRRHHGQILSTRNNNIERLPTIPSFSPRTLPEAPAPPRQSTSSRTSSIISEKVRKVSFVLPSPRDPIEEGEDEDEGGAGPGSGGRQRGPVGAAGRQVASDAQPATPWPSALGSSSARKPGFARAGRALKEEAPSPVVRCSVLAASPLPELPAVAREEETFLGRNLLPRVDPGPEYPRLFPMRRQRRRQHDVSAGHGRHGQKDSCLGGAGFRSGYSEKREPLDVVRQ